MNTTTNNAVINPTRTAVQLIPAAVITEFVDAFLYNFDEKQYAAMLALLLLVTSLVQNVVEDRKGKALFKPQEDAGEHRREV